MKLLRLKKCRLCKLEVHILPNGIRAKYCSNHLVKETLKKQKEKAKEKREEEKKMKERVKSTPLTLGEKAWKKFSKYLKRKHVSFQGYITCYTCDEIIPVNEAQAGHCFHRGRQNYKALDFDEKHIRLQCQGCNGFSAGQTNIFQSKLVKELGRKEVDKMIWRRANEPMLTPEEIKNLINYYKARI